ncbi:hypothetical protein BDZ91DRAFT_691788 [Kalaharituber pfeilii]|nr:hypothetical protein BDZ91DRAFT_691788 [Kalaharituber pfeilii]
MAGSSSSAEADISHLTAPQREALQQFVSLTNQEASAAIPILQRSQWNVQIAITKFFDGESADPVAEAISAQAARPVTSASSSSTSGAQPHRPSRRSTASSHNQNNSDITPAPRIVPAPSATIIRRSILLSILFFPFSVLYKIFSSGFSLFSIIFPFLRPLQRSFSQGAAPSRRATTNPRDTAARFIREFEESTGVKDLPWFEGGYAQAMDLAKKEVRIMMVILQSEEHDDTHVFNKETLGNQDVVSWVREQNIVLWGGSVSDSEGYQVSASLSTTAFPFLALISLTPPSPTASSTSPGGIPTTMSTILRVSGLLPPQTLLQKLNNALAAHADALSRIRAVRESQLADRQIREQQNSAYQASLARDRERARLRREEEERQRKAEEEARRREQEAALAQRRKLAWRRRKVRSGLLPVEPAPEVKAARVSIRFPDGERVTRRFEKDTKMEDVYAWVECKSVLGEDSMDEEEDKLLEGYTHQYGFRLVNPWPRKVYEAGETGGTVGDGLWPSGNLIVEEVEEDEGEEEGEAQVV